MRQIIGPCPPWLLQRSKFNLELNFCDNMKPFFPNTSIPQVAVSTPEELLHASLFGGRHPALGGNPASSRYREFNRWRLVSSLGFLDFNRLGFLKADGVIREADQSEKVAISYSLGAMGANLIARNVLGAREVVHISSMDRFYPGWAEYRRGTRRRPDYIAVDGNNDCFVVEAKGARILQSKTRKSLINKGQTKAVLKVFRYPGGMFNPYSGHGFAPKARVGLATEYPRDTLRIFGVDPDPGLRINVSVEEIQDAYFKILLEKAEGFGNEGVGEGVERGPRFVWTVPETFEEYLTSRRQLDQLPEGSQSTAEHAPVSKSGKRQLWHQFQTTIAEAGLLGEDWDLRTTRSFRLVEAATDEHLQRLIEIAQEMWGESGPLILEGLLREELSLSDGTRIELIAE